MGVANSGYWVIMDEKDKTYRLSFYAKRDNEFNGPLAISLESQDGEEVMVTASIPELTTEWTRYVVNVTAVIGSRSSRLVLSAEHIGVIHLDMVTLSNARNLEGAQTFAAHNKKVCHNYSHY